MNKFQTTETSLYINDTVYRPILEDNSLLIEVATGCSYRRCSFCDFSRDQFELIPIEKVKHNIKEIGKRNHDQRIVFLLGQNALCLPTSALLEIMGDITEHLSSVEEIHLYGRVDDILDKGPEDLLLLRKAGLTVIHIGIESGSDIVLGNMRKGFTSADTLSAAALLDAADIHYHTTYILGLGGRRHWQEHITKTAELFCSLRPLSIWALALNIWPETPLYEDMERGLFIPQSDEQMLAEERWIIANSKLDECLYMDTTALGRYTIIGVLPKGKEKLLKSIDQLLLQYSVDEIVYYKS